MSCVQLLLGVYRLKGPVQHDPFGRRIEGPATTMSKLTNGNVWRYQKPHDVAPTDEFAEALDIPLELPEVLISERCGLDLNDGPEGRRIPPILSGHDVRAVVWTDPPLGCHPVVV